MATVIWGSTWEAAPADGDAVSAGAGEIREVKEYLRKRLRGLLQISITTLDTDDTSFSIEVGSVIEVNGSIIEVITAAEAGGTITHITDETKGYCYVTDAGVFSFSETAPTWDNTKQGWYNGTSRAIAGFTRDGTSYDNKFTMEYSEKSSVDYLEDSVSFINTVTRYFSVPMVGTNSGGTAIGDGSELYMTNGTNLNLPVNLPNGAIVTAVYAAISGTITRINLVRSLLTNSTEEIMGGVTATGEDTSISNATIDNETYSYFVDCYNNTGAVRSIYGIKITYTIESPLP
jgi:hypothetical protein